MNDTILKDLLGQYLTGTITEKGKSELAQLITQPQYLQQMEEMMQETFMSDAFLNEENLKLRNEIEGWLSNKIAGEVPAKTMELSSRSKIKKLNRWNYAAAIILVALAGYLLFVQNKRTIKYETSPLAVSKNIEAPKISKATITLANGKTLYLDTVVNGAIALQEGTRLVKLSNGEIIYQTTPENSSRQIEYNTLTNPRGSKVIALTLNDGTKVWLNSESSLRYPTAFIDKERKVEITGEAYFEVSKDAVRKFIVSGNGVTTEVLGTHFNINTYANEPEKKVTLLEGSVKVSAQSERQKSEAVIHPGEQAKTKIGEKLKIIKGVNVEEVMAWKSGRFQFNKADLQEVMRQIARWYDVEIQYEGKIAPQQFGGKLQKNLNLSELLDGLEKSQVHFKIEGRKVIVMP